jgi:hypothetical protein
MLPAFVSQVRDTALELPAAVVHHDMRAALMLLAFGIFAAGLVLGWNVGARYVGK